MRVGGSRFKIELQSKCWQLHNRAAFECGFMRAKADAGPVGGLRGIRERIAIFDERHRELVRQVRVAAAVAAALGETQMGFLARVVDALSCVLLNALGQATGEIRALDRLGNLWLW